MGSSEQAVKTGLICRLCRAVSMRVVHVFGMEHISLLKKIAVVGEVKVSERGKCISQARLAESL